MFCVSSKGITECLQLQNIVLVTSVALVESAAQSLLHMGSVSCD